MKSSERYGQPRSLSRPALVALGIAIAAAVGLLLWSAWEYALTPVRSQIVSFTAIDDRQISVRYQITRQNPDQEVRCTIEAQDYDRTIVGELTDVIAPGLGTLTRTVIVPTRVRAVAVVVDSCRP
jgi:hypothetical protein